MLRPKAYGLRVDNRDVKNEILIALPRKECSVLFPNLEFVHLPPRTTLNEAGADISEAYFINAGVASLLNVMSNGTSVEVGLAGCEGFIGLPLISGLRTSASRVIMQVEGSAFQISARKFLRALEDCPSLASRLQGFSARLTFQISQVAVCNRLHNMEQRLARWLLMSQDRLNGKSIGLTQEFLSHMLGTRRASVTVAANVLQRDGAIELGRGSVMVRDRKKLETASCECYRAIVAQTKKWNDEEL
jgi:CRP-like cAMP-binding protein